MLLIALITMSVASTAQHLGFTAQVAKIASQIARCPKCVSFWCALAVLAYMRCNPLIAMGLSFFVAYLSYWWGLGLMVLNKLYDKIWQRINRM